MADTSADDVKSFLQRNMSVIIGFVSSFVLRVLLVGPSRVEVKLIVLLAVLIAIGIAAPTRKWIQTSPIMRGNPRWRNVILIFLNSMLSLGVFLAVQLVLVGFTSSIGTSELSSAELIVFVIVGLLLVFAAFDTVKTVLTAP